MILRTISNQSTKVLEALQDQFGDTYLYAFNWFAPGHPWSIELYKQVLESGKDVMSIETPLIGRTQWDSIKADEKSALEVYNRIGLNYVSSFHWGNYFIPNEASTDRLYELFEKTNTTMKPWRKDGNHIIYAMQIPEDTSLLGLDIFVAAQYDLTMLRQLTDRPIIVSLHPGCKNRPKVMQKYEAVMEQFYEVVDVTKSKIADVSTQELFEDAWCTVCYTSGAGYDSIIEGIPAVTLSERSFIRPLSGISWYDIKKPKTIKREPWLARLAYCQWSLEEIKTGNFKKHVDSLKHTV